MKLKYLIIIYTLISLTGFTDCHSSQGLEFKRYESRGYLGPWRYIYYKALYKNPHFPMLRLDLNQDSSFIASGCSVEYGGCFEIHKDTLCLLPNQYYYRKNKERFIYDQQIISIYPKKLLNRSSSLLDIVKSPKDTWVWIVDK